MWEAFSEGKQTVTPIAASFKCSPSTVKRRLSEKKFEWKQPNITGAGVIHLDATYFNRNNGVLIALESVTGRLLYMKHINHERAQDYEDAVKSIESRGYTIRGIVIDGLQKLFKLFYERKIQMCQFHMVALIRRKLTKNPQLDAGRELLCLVYQMKDTGSADFKLRFEDWKLKWQSFLDERTTNPITGKSVYTHQRLRSAMYSLECYMPWLFTFEDVPGMPNTNNLLEGTFTDLKKNLAVHSGMTEANRKRFVSGFFLAYADKHK